MHPNLKATAARNLEIIRRCNIAESMTDIAADFKITPARVRQIFEKSLLPDAPFGLKKNAVRVIKNVLGIDGRTLTSADVFQFIEQGHLHKNHPNFGKRSIDTISAAYREDRAVMEYLARSSGAFGDFMELKR